MTRRLSSRLSAVTAHTTMPVFATTKKGKCLCSIHQFYYQELSEQPGANPRSPAVRNSMLIIPPKVRNLGTQELQFVVLNYRINDCIIASVGCVGDDSITLVKL